MAALGCALRCCGGSAARAFGTVTGRLACFVKKSAVLAFFAVLATTGAHAGLFDDEEARKAILELRARVTQLDEAQKARTAEAAAAGQAALVAALKQTNDAMTEQLTALRRGLLDLNNQLEAMRSELAKLRGSDEQLGNDLAEIQKRQRDVAQTLDDRLRRLEPVKMMLDGKELMVEQEARRAYDDAMAAIRAGEFDKAVVLLGAFQRRFGGSPLADWARFWLGNAHYGKRDYKEAITAFRGFLNSAPDHPRAAEALLSLANSQAETKDPRGARKTLEDLIKAYPQSEAAQAGRERLPNIK